MGLISVRAIPSSSDQRIDSITVDSEPYGRSSVLDEDSMRICFTLRYVGKEGMQ